MVYPTAGEQWVGQPVCLLLKDGSLYIGTLEDINKGQLTLSKAQKCKTKGKTNSRTKSKTKGKSKKHAKTSSFLGPMLGFGEGGAAQVPSAGQGAAVPNPATGTSSSGGLLGTLGTIGKVLPMIKVGMSMVQSLWPLLGMFKI